MLGLFIPKVNENPRNQTLLPSLSPNVTVLLYSRYCNVGLDLQWVCRSSSLSLSRWFFEAVGYTLVAGELKQSSEGSTAAAMCFSISRSSLESDRRQTSLFHGAFCLYKHSENIILCCLLSENLSWCEHHICISYPRVKLVFVNTSGN